MIRIWLTFALFFVLMTASSFPVVAQGEDEQPTFFLPAIHGYVKSTPPPTPVPTATPKPTPRPGRGRQPYDVDPQKLVFYPIDFTENDYEYDYRNDYDYDLTQDEALPMTDELHNAGVTKGYRTYMVRDENFTSAGPEELGTTALVFASEDQARAYYFNRIQGFVDEGLERYQDRSLLASSAVYVRRETPALYGHGLCLKFNLVFSTYSIDTDGTDLSDYLHRMNRKFLVETTSDP